MGSPLGPTLANIFLSLNEVQWLKDCPSNFKPSYYRRYVDDTIAIFTHPSHAEQFRSYLNAKHKNIHFTMETQAANSLPFLDTKIVINDNKIETSIYRKPTFSGLGTSFFSATCRRYKINSIRTLLFRAYSLSSSYLVFCNEIEFLKKFFINNGYPLHSIENRLRLFLDKIFTPVASQPTVKRDKKYFCFPYYRNQSEKLATNFKNALENAYPQLNMRGQIQ